MDGMGWDDIVLYEMVNEMGWYGMGWDGMEMVWYG